MPKFKVAKLVRDKIVDSQLASGSHTEFRRLSTGEHKQELIKKIIEEAQEIIQANPGDIAAEIADVQQAIDDLMNIYGISAQEVSKAQAAKNKKSGAFKKGLYVEFIEMQDSDPWIDYYRKNADRYPEIT